MRAAVDEAKKHGLPVHAGGLHARLRCRDLPPDIPWGTCGSFPPGRGRNASVSTSDTITARALRGCLDMLSKDSCAWDV
jgi:hypothetical protein